MKSSSKNNHILIIDAAVTMHLFNNRNLFITFDKVNNVYMSLDHGDLESCNRERDN